MIIDLPFKINIFRISFFTIIVQLLLPGSSALAKSQFLVFNPRPFQPLSAEITEVKFDYIVLDQRRVNATIGSHYPIFEYFSEAHDNKSEKRFQTGIFGLGFNRLQIKEGFSFDLNSYDAIFGIYADYLWGKYSFSLRYTHTSTHLSEGVFLNNNEIVSTLRYSREHLRFLTSREFTIDSSKLRIYSGFLWVNAPVAPVELKDRFLIQLQVGLELEFGKFSFVQPFIAIDLTARTETNYLLTKSLAFGLKFIGTSQSSFRLQFHYYHGIDPRGNFYKEKEEFFGAGIAYYH